MTNIGKKALALSTAVMLAASAMLSGCGNKSDTQSAPDSSAAETTTTTSAAATTTTAATTTAAETTTAAPEEQPETEALQGKPWATSIISGNLPSAKPDVKDDLFAHYSYDFLKANQDASYTSTADEFKNEYMDAVIAVINDETKNDPELEQLRILYEQAADIETLKEQGASELMQYMDMIDSVGSIEELNKLLVSKDFPFSPFIHTDNTVTDTKGNNLVGIAPSPLIFDIVLYGGEYYNDLDDESHKAVYDTFVDECAMLLFTDFELIGMDVQETYNAVIELAAFETEYMKYCEYNGKYNKMEYGTLAKATQEHTMKSDDVYELCPNIPLKGILKKLGKSGTKEFHVDTPESLKAMNDIWTEDNLDMLKLMAKAKLFDETRPYRDPTARWDLYNQYSVPVPDESEFAFEACDQINTFAHETAKIYVNEHLGEKAKERIYALTQDLVNTYKQLVTDTGWLDDSSRKAIIEKLDNMSLNVLEPIEGYTDFGKLELTPTEEGGTLLGNYLKLKQYNLDNKNKLINKPAIKSSTWLQIEPSLDNAFYDSGDNSINIFPGYVTGKAYSEDIDDSNLLSSLGFVIGHEISHGFDYDGSQFDAYGKAENVFSDNCLDIFLEKTKALADYYSTVELTDTIKVDGDVVKGEAAADLSGLQAVLELSKNIDGINYDKFFENFANSWADIMMEEMFMMFVSDEHPFGHLRVNITSQMFDTIYDEFGIKEGDTMYLAPEKRIIMWGKSA